MARDNDMTEFARELAKSQKVAVFCHMRPDGDTLGAAGAMYRILQALGKRAYIVCADPVPEKFLYWELYKNVHTEIPTGCDTFLAVDCSTEERMGDAGYAFRTFRGRKFNIDHHISNTYYADYNYVEERSACCELIYELAVAMGITPDAVAAQSLLLGICTDSGSFSHSDVNERTLAIAAKLYGCGANMEEISYNLFKKQTKVRMLLSNLTMPTMRFYHNDRFSAIVVTKKNLERANALPSASEGFVDYLLTVDTVEVAACLMEMKPEVYKISLRSKGPDVNAVASYYGGGGHILASGCMINGDLEEVLDKLSYTVGQYLED